MSSTDTSSWYHYLVRSTDTSFCEFDRQHHSVRQCEFDRQSWCEFDRHLVVVSSCYHHLVSSHTTDTSWIHGVSSTDTSPWYHRAIIILCVLQTHHAVSSTDKSSRITNEMSIKVHPSTQLARTPLFTRLACTPFDTTGEMLYYGVL